MTAENDRAAIIREVLATVDRKDADGFVAFLTKDASFRFGNAEAVTGRDAIRDAVAGFFDSIASLSHHIERIWTAPEAVACDGEVTYVRHDGLEIRLPFADVFGMRGDKIDQYLIYIDIAPLYA